MGETTGISWTDGHGVDWDELPQDLRLREFPRDAP